MGVVGERENGEMSTLTQCGVLVSHVIIFVYCFLQPSSAGTEEAWLAMYTPMFGYLYFNSVDGLVQRERPAVFRPYLAVSLTSTSVLNAIMKMQVNYKAIR